ncbi:MAG: zinc ribbon domain-containing protein [Oscillospiraceae bacterium]|nr:zinc ribbon domain-containing protein [Clostridia bacterium]MBR3239866.1 zinc ribbon domain-containing protein [Oscillospiraceae bacterium]
MKCPYCGSVCADDALYCPSCKQPLPSARDESRSRQEKQREKRTAGQKALTAVLVVLFAVGLAVGGYKLFSWIRSYQLTRLYTRGAYAPTLSEVQMDDMRQGHAVIFFGRDGDQIYVPELQRSLSISGGVARMELADSEWFSNNVTDVEYADITLSPMLISESGRKTELPQFNFQVDVPVSPLLVTSPAEERTTVVVGVYPLTLNVVPGSTVFVNGEDVTESVDRSGYLSTYVSVKPIGDNVITLIVRTPKHRECRRELVIFRQHYDIELELDTTVSSVSTARTMAVTGTTEPGASIAVDTDHIPESLSVDPQTGRFSFVAQFTNYGNNIVRFRATKEGKQDAEITLNVNYRPSLDEMSGRAWAMDYPQLRLLFENWRYQSFVCKGPIIDSFTDDDGRKCLVMDVGTTERQLVILVNDTTITSPTLGRSYQAYAYVDGQHMYQSEYYPMLVALYMDVAG